MGFTLSAEEQIARARNDLRIGLPVILRDGEVGYVLAAVETLSSERLAAFRGFEVPYLALTARRAETLRIPAYDGDLVRVYLPGVADCAWLRASADPAQDLSSPMKGPYRALRDGDATPARIAIALAKQAQLLPAALLGSAGDSAFPGLTTLDLPVIWPVLAAHSPLGAVSGARVPLEVSENGAVQVFRPQDGGEEHYAIRIGDPTRDKPVLARLHSACFTGDVIGSLKCDCGPQLRAAMAQIAQEGAGVLLYLNQEGRGIGLANKMRAYALQDQGFDTVEANHRLGFEDDERNFRLGAEILQSMGFGAVRLMTNNPNKVAMMEATGLRVVERVPLRVGENPLNAHYLATKARKSGHFL